MKLRYAYDEILPTTATDSEQVLSTVSALARRGFDVDLTLPRVPGREPPTISGLRQYYQVEGGFGLQLVDSAFDAVRPLQKAAHARRAALLEGDPDLVYTRNLACVAAALLAGHRVAYEHYRPWPDQYPVLRGYLRMLMTHPRFVGAMFHSEHARSSYERMGIPPERLTVVHNGYDPRRLLPRLSQADARALLGLPRHATIATYTGRVNARKGLDTLLAVARRCPDVLFVIVGSEGDGPVESEARRLQNVVIVPWQPFDRVTPYLYASTMLLVPPSLTPLQGFGTTVLPMKLFLYLAAGRPILAPRAPDTSEILRDGENALLVQPGDPDAAAAGVMRLALDGELRNKLALGAQATAAPLTWDARATKIERFLRDRLPHCALPRSSSPSRQVRAA